MLSKNIAEKVCWKLNLVPKKTRLLKARFDGEYKDKGCFMEM